jgi:alpha-L-arabinofuranosidase
MNTPAYAVLLGALLLTTPAAISGAELHVSTSGNDANRGTRGAPLRTIQRAADLAEPGDIITVHKGVYRERINPPRGGTSDRRRIVYQAARGDKVEIKGSEVVTNWVKVQDNVWKATLPNSFFGAFNPYKDTIRGDWFDPRGREHHTGAVYLNGEWLVEATKLDEVLAAPGATPAWLNQASDQVLLNVAWLQPGSATASSKRTPAASYAAQHGIQKAPCTEGGECIGWINHGDWVRYEGVDFGNRTEQVEIRGASATEGGTIELRLDGPEGELLGSCFIPNTGDWQAWSSFKAMIKPVSGVKTLCLAFKARPTGSRAPLADAALWFAKVDETNTTIWAQFRNVNPNEQLVEINVRRTVFYPDKPGRDYITVRGFGLRHAATPWAPPTAEQVGLIGTHWSKGWLIENNSVSHSICSGIALGKYGDEFDNTSANSAEGYVKTIERALKNGWNKETIGHHVVRNNTISHCEQAGVVGSLGAAFSTVTGNTIHDVHVRRLFSGAEMAGIKFHAAIDSVIEKNHIYRTCLGLWLDWMAQGTRVSANLFHDNGQDLFMEVNHGPFVIDNNLFLSAANLLDMSQGGAYLHNLFHGKINSRPELSRETPYHPAHTTSVAGLVNIKGGDNRFYNNLFVGRGESTDTKGGSTPPPSAGYGLQMYNARELPLQTGGNVYYFGALPYRNDKQAVVQPAFDPGVKLDTRGQRVFLHLSISPEIKEAETDVVTTEMLGQAKIPAVPYENADGSPLRINTDFFGKKRNKNNPSPGPFEKPGTAAITLRLR